MSISGRLVRFWSMNQEPIMQSWMNSPAFVAYALAGLALSANMGVLWAYSGAVRGKTHTVMNAEDVGTVAKRAEVVPADPPAVARVLRAHANATAASVPFLFLGLLYVLLGGPALPAMILFGVFVAARLLHSVAYLAEKQPFRTIAFATGGLTTIALLGNVAWLVVRGA
ncbi:MAG: MAPEG family protein [Polyangiaceae bacterium]|nr:MAPEG family protein [Polyangiaceae bacterium]